MAGKCLDCGCGLPPKTDPRSHDRLRCQLCQRKHATKLQREREQEKREQAGEINRLTARTGLNYQVVYCPNNYFPAGGLFTGLDITTQKNVNPGKKAAAWCIPGMVFRHTKSKKTLIVDEKGVLQTYDHPTGNPSRQNSAQPKAATRENSRGQSSRNGRNYAPAWGD